MARRLSPARFEQAVARAIDALPEDFRSRLENVAFMVDPFPDEETLDEMECEGPYDLLGLYRGWPITERGTDYQGVLPDTIHLYREPILAYCAETGEDVVHCIVETVIHEVGHYYGLSDDEMHAIEAEARKEGRAGRSGR